MEQMSFFDGEKAPFPKTHEDVLALHKQYIDEGEKDEDAFSWNEIQNGYSYFFYGTKVMELIFTASGKARLRIKQEFGKEDEEEIEEGKYITLTQDTDDLLKYIEILKKAKRDIFRNLIIETFACCNDFVSCSDARECLHPENRYYNGCMYRKNLEAGKIFYGKNKNNEKDQISRMLIFDVETANEKNIGSICAIGWILLDHDEVVDKGYSLINPHCPFSGICTGVHGITPKDVADAPCFADYWKSTLGVLMTSSLVVAHSANFDLSAIEQALYAANVADPGINYMDSLPVLKALIDAPSYKLVDLAAGIQYEYNAHNAGEDVHALYEVLCYVRDLCGYEDLAEMFLRSPSQIENTHTNNYIPHEIQDVRPRIPVRTHCNEDVQAVDSCFCGLRFCITGDFPGYERADIERMIYEHGGRPTTAVSGKTDYLIVGEYIDPITGRPAMTCKHRKALELAQQGARVRIISIDTFLQMIGKTEGGE